MDPSIQYVGMLYPRCQDLNICVRLPFFCFGAKNFRSTIMFQVFSLCERFCCISFLKSIDIPYMLIYIDFALPHIVRSGPLRFGTKVRWFVCQCVFLKTVLTLKRGFVRAK